MRTDSALTESISRATIESNRFTFKTNIGRICVREIIRVREWFYCSPIRCLKSWIARKWSILCTRRRVKEIEWMRTEREGETVRDRRGREIIWPETTDHSVEMIIELLLPMRFLRSCNNWIRVLYGLYFHDWYIFFFRSCFHDTFKHSLYAPHDHEIFYLQIISLNIFRHFDCLNVSVQSQLPWQQQN